MSFVCTVEGCGARLNCIDTRRRMGNINLRKYVCPKCQKRYSSEESIIHITVGGDHLLAREHEFNQYRLQMREELLAVFSRYQPKKLNQTIEENSKETNHGL